MEVGFATLNGFGRDVGPAELARTLEDMGYDSLWVGEHSHIPVERRTPYPMGGDLPEAYSHMMDPYVSLMAAGAATERLKLATGVALPLESNIFGLAKSVATLDVLSGGRVLFGVGAGWNVEQFENQTSVPFRQRYRALGGVHRSAAQPVDRAGSSVPRRVLRLRPGPLLPQTPAGAPSAGDSSGSPGPATASAGTRRRSKSRSW